MRNIKKCLLLFNVYLINQSHLSSATARHHGNSCLDAEGASLPVTEPLRLPLKLRPSQETRLSCEDTHTHRVGFNSWGRHIDLIHSLETHQNQNQNQNLAKP